MTEQDYVDSWQLRRRGVSVPAGWRIVCVYGYGRRRHRYLRHFEESPANRKCRQKHEMTWSKDGSRRVCMTCQAWRAWNYRRRLHLDAQAPW